MPNRKHIKCAKIVGETMGNYHPHGDMAIYPTLVHMAQPWAMRDTLIEGQGNFGSMDGDPPASMRYTEARLTHLGATLMEDMEKDTVNFVPNYDETTTEPSRFSRRFSKSAGQWRDRHRGRNGHQHASAQPCARCVNGICALIDQPDIGTDELLMNTSRGRISRPAAPSTAPTGIRQYFETGRGS